jgi:hypothetical protein
MASFDEKAMAVERKRERVASLSRCAPALFMWPRQESNLNLELRKLLYYPLYYVARCVQGCKSRVFTLICKQIKYGATWQHTWIKAHNVSISAEICHCNSSWHFQKKGFMFLFSNLSIPLAVTLLFFCLAGSAFFIWFYYKATKRVIKELKAIKTGDYKSANWTILILALLFVVGFVGSLVNVLLGNL